MEIAPEIVYKIKQIIRKFILNLRLFNKSKPYNVLGASYIQITLTC